MIHKMAEKIVTGQIKKGTLGEADRNKYIYAYEVLFNQVFNLGIALVLGAVTHELIAVCAFLAIYIPLRKYAGGFHAKTNGRCMVYSTLVVIGVIVINRILDGCIAGFWMPAALAAVSVILLAVAVCMTPVEAANKRLTEEERLRCQKKVRLFGWIHIVCLTANLFWMKWDFLSIDFLLAYVVLAGVLLAGKWMKESVM